MLDINHGNTDSEFLLVSMLWHNVWHNIRDGYRGFRDFLTNFHKILQAGNIFLLTVFVEIDNSSS